MAEPIEVTLDTPIKRGDSEITKVTLTKPASGALRGVKLAELMELDYNAVASVLPRVSSPTLTIAEISSMDPADFMQLAGGVVSFLLPKSVQDSLQG
ncbi:hypothetical protein BIY27_11385 [Gibbsiella quercinecans]|uniref:phage tail assembly protein n=1 Tax=Gibbsiella quercinecans TaxID=929813 RepID=UPI000EF20F22|nr:phage tail assembly protein [Gibbsiella quercinecans]RLM12559.1 hypothetical protein BIY27_11385 [Gibbsiella quercinecans]